MPHAVDTNVLARVLTNDGSEQSLRASQFVRDNEVFVPDTVLLETEWLMRSRLGIARNKRQELLETLLSWPGISFADRKRVVSAVEAHRAGLDLADAMHLYASGDCDMLATFDMDFIRLSSRLSDVVAVGEP